MGASTEAKSDFPPLGPASRGLLWLLVLWYRPAAGPRTARFLPIAKFEQMRIHDFLLIVAAEGTRSRTTRWKTGFYQIALRAKGPIVCAGPDFPTRRGVFGPIIHPTGDYERDMAPAYAFFRTLSRATRSAPPSPAMRTDGKFG